MRDEGQFNCSLFLFLSPNNSSLEPDIDIAESPNKQKIALSAKPTLDGNSNKIAITDIEVSQ